MNVGETVTAVIQGEAVRFVVAEELAFATTRWLHGKEQTRWREKEIVKTRKGSYVIRDSQISLWEGEPSVHRYSVYASLDEAVKALDPTDQMDRQLLDQLGKLHEVSKEI